MSESRGPDPLGQIGPLGLALFSGRTHTLGNCQQAWDLSTGPGTHLRVLLQERVYCPRSPVQVDFSVADAPKSLCMCLPRQAEGSEHEGLST